MMLLDLNKYQEKYKISSNRLKDWDYSRGLYFITICTKNRENYFGEIVNNQMKLNTIGKIVENFWKEIPQHFLNVKLKQFIVMPNHIHGILYLEGDNNSANRRDVAMLRLYNGKNEFNKEFMSAISPKPNSLPTIIRSFKSVSTKTINRSHPNLYFSWQSRYYEHIIRNENSLGKIQNYIKKNPANWYKDENYNQSKS